MTRNLNRSVARAHYKRFAKLWRQDLRTSGLYGSTGAPKRPTFNQWYAMHQRDLAMTKESSPADVQEHLGIDPWAEHEALWGRQFDGDLGSGEKNERGVVHVDMVGGDTKKDDI